MEREFRIQIRKKTIYTCTWRSLLYALCFFALCVIDQRIKTYSYVGIFRNLTGTVIGVLIISHYRWRDFAAYKVQYLALAGLCAVGGAAAIVCGSRNGGVFGGFLVMALDVILFCFIIMHTFIAVRLEKKRPALKKSFLAVWAVMMALMIVSKSEYLWPLCFLVMFGCFYLTDFTQEEREDMLQGALNGIILGFFILQGLCFVFRPYDRVRYLGSYDNPNLNALFYTEVLAAVLGKILYVHRKKTGRAIKVFYWLGSGVVLSFLFMSIGRAAWVASFFIVLVALWALNRIMQKKRFWCHTGLILLCTCLMFPVCFSAARYIPPLFHHPVWFLGEYDEDKVHSYDPWNCWKYVEIDEFMDAAVGRIIGSFQNLWEHVGLNRGKDAASGAQSAVGNAETPTEKPVASNMGLKDFSKKPVASNMGLKDFSEKPVASNMGLDDFAEKAGAKKTAFVGNEKDGSGAETVNVPGGENGAILDTEQEADSFLTRKTIYMYYAKHLNLWGYPADEQGFQLTPVYRVGHAHNIFLQYGTDFGIPVMVLFAVLTVWGALRLSRAFLKTGDFEKAVYLLYLLITVLFGMFECSWGTGSLSITMLFLSLGAAAGETNTPQ